MPDEAIHLSRFSTLTSFDGASATVVPLLSCNQWTDIDSSELRVEGIPTSSELHPGYGLRAHGDSVRRTCDWVPVLLTQTIPFSLLVVVLQPSDMLIGA